MSHNQDVGTFGEGLVAQWYVSNGYELLARNWRPGPGALNPRGELDIVLAKDGLVVFCEVKTRTSNRYGTGATSVGHAKQRALRRLATQWLSSSSGNWDGFRFDVVVVNAAGQIRSYQSCF